LSGYKDLHQWNFIIREGKLVLWVEEGEGAKCINMYGGWVGHDIECWNMKSSRGLVRSINVKIRKAE